MPAPAEDPAEAAFRNLIDFAARAADPSLTEAADRLAVEVCGEFVRSGVPFVLMKGPALARLLYREGEQRRYMDVDVLLGPGARGRAASVLERLGFENATAAAGVDDFTGAVPAETWMRDRDLPVDLHTRFPGAGAPADETWRHLTQGLQAIVVNGQELPVFGRPALALHLAVHAAQHGPNDPKAIGDLRRGLSRWSSSDWQAAAVLAERLEAVGPFGAGLRLVPAGEDLAAGLDLPPSAGAAWEIEHRWTRPRGNFHLAALEGVRHPGDLIALLRRALLPRPEWIVREFRWAGRGRTMLAAGYVRHALRLPCWTARAWSYRRRMRRATRAANRERPSV
jgi:hypothetical protein